MTKQELLEKLNFLWRAEEDPLPAENQYYCALDYTIKEKKLREVPSKFGFRFEHNDGDITNDTETIHVYADQLLLEYINDPEIKEAFQRLRKWYA